MEANQSAPKSNPFIGWVIATLVLPFVGLATTFTFMALDGASRPPRDFNDLSSQTLSPLAIAGLASGAIIAIVAYIVYGMTIAKMWAVVQDGRARFTPATAACLAAIPLINLIGTFFGFVGLAPELNRKLNEMGRPKMASEGMALGAAITFVVSTLFGCIPVLGACVSVPGSLVAFVLWAVCLFQMAKAAHFVTTGPTLPQYRTAAVPPDFNPFSHPEQY